MRGSRTRRAALQHVDDAALVRAPRWLVHHHLVDVGGWPRWWPGAEPLGDEPSDLVHHLRLAIDRPWRPVRHLRVGVRPWGRRDDLGVHLDVTGDVVAAVEFWLEDDPHGTVVHHIAVIDPMARAAPQWRPTVRRALWAMDERLVPEVRAAVLPGTRPGSTPRHRAGVLPRLACPGPTGRPTPH